VDDNKTVFIVGGGWAGLSAGVRLKHHGYQIQLFESSRQLGGRARGTRYKGKRLDNGQHILLGSCSETLELFKLLGMQEADYLYRQSLKLELLNLSNNQPNVKIQASNLAAPLHLLLGFFRAKGLSVKEKYFLIEFFIFLTIKHFQLKQDHNLESLLKQHKQSKSIIDKFWEPLCLSIMNTPITTASAQLFLNTLKVSFSGSKKNSDLLLFTRPLCETLPHNASEYIQTKYSRIHLNSKVKSIKVKNNRIIAINTGDKTIPCDQLILATPLYVTVQLLAPHKSCHQIVSQLQKIDHQPIYTIYLSYQEKFTLDQNMIGLLNGYSQWVFDKSLCQQQGLLAVIISGQGKHQLLSKAELIKKINTELQSLITLPKLDWAIVVKENKATINCTVKNNRLRPSNQTPIKGLYIAGDYTNTGYPSTLEGAILSGRKATEPVIY
jgi:squalene-associated FAD-dependent desaturase